MTSLEICPVCKRIVAVSNVRRIVYAHHDTVYNNCPMGGHPLGADNLSHPNETVPA